MRIAIFNPEHDLCLANGGAHYMPPSSALSYARSHAYVMRYLYPDAVCVDADGVGAVYSSMISEGVTSDDIAIVPWGWDSSLLYRLKRQGIPDVLLPSSDYIDIVRQLSHRGTPISLQRYVRQGFSEEEVARFVSDHPSSVLKAPWSGSGRGLRWIGAVLTQKDKEWVRRVLSTQRSVMMEPRYDVVQNFAVEYVIDSDGTVRYTGMSLFNTHHGVYRGNILLADEEIIHYIEKMGVTIDKGKMEEIRLFLQTMAEQRGYRGAVGIDMFVYRDTDGKLAINYCVEMNFRHTMGMVACGYLQQHPESRGETIFKEINKQPL